MLAVYSLLVEKKINSIKARGRCAYEQGTTVWPILIIRKSLSLPVVNNSEQHHYNTNTKKTFRILCGKQARNETKNISNRCFYRYCI